MLQSSRERLPPLQRTEMSFLNQKSEESEKNSRPKAVCETDKSATRPKMAKHAKEEVSQPEESLQEPAE